MIMPLRKGLNITALIACAWVFLYPHPYYLAVGAAILYLPAAILITLIKPASFTIDEPENTDEKLINIFMPLMFTSAALAIRMVSDNEIIVNADFLIISFLVLFTSLAILITIRKSNIFCVLLISILYSPSVLIFSNSIGHIRQQIEISGEVADKQIRIKPVRHIISIQHGGAVTNITVSKELYESYQIGDHACAKEAEGWLSIRTISPARCESP